MDAFQVLSKLLPLIQATVRTKITFRGDDARFAVSQAASLCLIANEIIFETREGGGGRVTLKMPRYDQVLLKEAKSGFASF